MRKDSGRAIRVALIETDIPCSQHSYPEAIRSLIEDEAHLLTFYEFPASMHRHIQTTNAIESLWSLVRQRTNQIDVFTTETSCLTIVWATIQDIRLHKITLG
jgi:putative transposase